ncbi:MAG TPA: hypothetical protein VGN61_06820 [Verrucomicrobiae bacterium]
MTEQAVATSVKRLATWLDTYGELSQDVDDYFNNRYGRWAKGLYYKHPKIGTLAVAPLVFQEAFLPWTRRFFWPAQRFPLADAQFAMGFAYLCQATGDQAYYKKAVGFLDALVQTRCPGYENYCWGYPFGWETVWGNFKAGTPLITTTPYGYEAFEAVHEIDGDEQWLAIMRSVAIHALKDYKETEHAPGIWASSYSPLDKRKVVNANAYRAFLLTAASVRFSDKACAEAALRPLAFVLNAQNEDGSWLYALDGWDRFIDHYHTCFVMKALAKILRLTGDARCAEALKRGVQYYLDVLIDDEGLPRPFAKPPRLVIYRRELYDLAEAVNLAVLLGGDFPKLREVRDRCISEITGRWQLSSGAYRTRKLLIGWNNVPMHRWGLSIAFRSLCLFLRQQTRQAKAAA